MASRWLPRERESAMSLWTPLDWRRFKLFFFFKNCFTAISFMRGGGELRLKSAKKKWVPLCELYFAPFTIQVHFSSFLLLLLLLGCFSNFGGGPSSPPPPPSLQFTTKQKRFSIMQIPPPPPSNQPVIQNAERPFFLPSSSPAESSHSGKRERGRGRERGRERERERETNQILRIAREISGMFIWQSAISPKIWRLVYKKKLTYVFLCRWATPPHPQKKEIIALCKKKLKISAPGSLGATSSLHSWLPLLWQIESLKTQLNSTQGSPIITMSTYTQPPTVVRKMEAQLEYMYIYSIYKMHTHMHVWRFVSPLTKFLHRSSAGSSLRVRCWLGIRLNNIGSSTCTF